MSRDRSTQTKLIRLGQILRVFMEKEKVSSTWLSQHFQTTPRTIQRDLLLLKESGFPLHEIQKGRITGRHLQGGPLRGHPGYPQVLDTQYFDPGTRDIQKRADG